LGLVGILESRSSLRQRIERLMDFRPPRKAGLTLASALAVLGFAALAVPMGEAPAPIQAPQLAGSEALTNIPAPPVSTNAALLDQKIKVSTLVHDGKLLYEMDRLDAADVKLKEAIKQDPQNQAALYYLNLVSEARFKAAGGDLRELLPVPNPYARTNSIRVSAGRQAILRKLDNMRMNEVSFDGVPLGEVLRSLADEIKKRDLAKGGVSFLISSALGAKAPPAGAVAPATASPKPETSATPVSLASLPITIKPPLTNVRLLDVLDAIVKVADRPIKYSVETYRPAPSVEGYVIVFSAKTGQESPPLYVRTFKVDPNTLLDGLHVAKGPAGTNGLSALVPALLDVLAKAGVDVDPKRNPGKAIYYNHGHGTLLVRATMRDLDIIEATIQMLNVVPPQINIKCKFVEVPQDDTKAFGFDWYLGSVLMTNGAIRGQANTAPSNTGPPTATNPFGAVPGNPLGTAPTTISPNSTNQILTSGLGNPSTSPLMLTGILTASQYRVVIKALQQRSGAELLAQPEVTTTSGRQAQMKTVNIQTVVKGINKRALTPPGITTTNGDDSSLYVTEEMEFGPVLDVIPSVLGDGYTIALTVIPTVTEFLGYAEGQTNRLAVYVNGAKKWVFPPEPNVRQRQMTASVRVWDGQTVVLGGLTYEMVSTLSTLKDQVPMLADLPLVGRLFRNESKTIQKKYLLVFVTPTLIDPAGNRVHSEEDIPFARDAVPPQAPR
jgi:Flp pilus assembly secretin CpaC